MEEKHKIKLARLARGIKAQRAADIANANDARDQDIAFGNEFTGSMIDVVIPAFDEYKLALDEHGFDSHRKKIDGAPGVKLFGMAFVFGPPVTSAQKAAPALVFRIMPSVAERRALASFEPVGGSSSTIATLGVNQITRDWIHDQLNTVLEKAGK